MERGCSKEKSGVTEGLIVVDNKIEVEGTRTICSKAGCNDKDGTDPEDFPTVVVGENEVVTAAILVENDDEVDEIVIGIQFEGDAEDSATTLNTLQMTMLALFLSYF